MSKIALITGITGQDGSYLSELLLNKNYKVHGIVRPNFDINDPNQNFRIQSFQNKLNLHNLDVNNKKDLEILIQQVKPDEVYHLAAQSQDGHSFDNEFYTFNLNLNYTHSILSSVYNNNNKTKFFLLAHLKFTQKITRKKLTKKQILIQIQPTEYLNLQVTIF